MLRARFVAHYTHIVNHSRVILSIPDGWGSDYINASYINVRHKTYCGQTVCHVQYAIFMFMFMFNFTG